MLYPAAHIVLLQCGGVSLENMSELAPRPVVTRNPFFLGWRDACGHTELAEEPNGLMERGQSCGGHGREVVAVLQPQARRTALFPGTRCWEGKEREDAYPGTPPQAGNTAGPWPGDAGLGHHEVAAGAQR